MFRNIFWGKKSSIFVVCGRETWLTVEACNGQILIRSLTLTSCLSLSSLMVIWFWLGIITRDNKPSLTNRTELGEERLPTLRLYNTLYYLVFHYITLHLWHSGVEWLSAPMGRGRLRRYQRVTTAPRQGVEAWHRPLQQVSRVSEVLYLSSFGWENLQVDW